MTERVAMITPATYQMIGPTGIASETKPWSTVDSHECRFAARHADVGVRSPLVEPLYYSFIGRLLCVHTHVINIPRKVVRKDGECLLRRFVADKINYL